MIVDSVAMLDLVCCTAVAQVQTSLEILSSITASETLLQIQQKTIFLQLDQDNGHYGFYITKTLT